MPDMEQMKDRVIRIEDKLDRLIENENDRSIEEIKQRLDIIRQMERNNISLEHHIKRTDTLEALVAEVRKETKILGNIKWLLGIVGVTLSGVAILITLLKNWPL